MGGASVKRAVRSDGVVVGAAGSVPPPFVYGKNNAALTLGNFSSASAIGNNQLAGAFGNYKTKLNTVG